MSVSPEELIAINSLLIEREEAYARVAEIEQSICHLLGADFPFEPPRAIPSSAHKRKASKKRRAASKKAQGPPKIRRLKPGECAYRFTWSEKEHVQVREATELRAIETFIKHPTSGNKLLKVETLDIDSEVVDCIFNLA